MGPSGGCCELGIGWWCEAEKIWVSLADDGGGGSITPKSKIARGVKHNNKGDVLTTTKIDPLAKRDGLIDTRMVMCGPNLMAQNRPQDVRCLALP